MRRIEEMDDLSVQQSPTPLSASDSMWEFSCLEPVSGQNMCFNSGTCAQDNCTADAGGDCGHSHCICPEGFTHDMDWFHFRNCVKPINSSRDFLIVFAVVFVLVCVWYLFFVHRTLRRAARTIGVITFGSLLGHVGLVLSVFFQNGCYEACAVVSIVDFTLCAIAAQKTIILAVAPVLSLQQHSIARYARGSKVWNALCCFGFFACGIAMLVFTRNRSTNNYNQAAFAMGTILWTCGFSNMSAVCLAVWNLRRQLIFTERVSRKRYRGIMLRMRVLQFSSVNIFLPFFTIFLAAPIVISRFHSFPFYFIAFDAQVMFGTLNFTAAVLFFIKPNSYSQYEAVADIAAANRNNKRPLQHQQQQPVTTGPQWSQKLSRKLKHVWVDEFGNEREPEQLEDFIHQQLLLNNAVMDMGITGSLGEPDVELVPLATRDEKSFIEATEAGEEEKHSSPLRRITQQQSNSALKRAPVTTSFSSRADEEVESDKDSDEAEGSALIVPLSPALDPFEEKSARPYPAQSSSSTVILDYRGSTCELPTPTATPPPQPHQHPTTSIPLEDLSRVRSMYDVDTEQKEGEELEALPVLPPRSASDAEAQ